MSIRMAGVGHAVLRKVWLTIVRKRKAALLAVRDMGFEDDETFDPVACSIGLCQTLGWWLSAWNPNTVSEEELVTGIWSKLETRGQLDGLTTLAVFSEMTSSSSAGNQEAGK